MSRCEDFPCCGHTDGLPCDWSPPNHSAAPWLLHEPGSPEWFDAREEYEWSSSRRDADSSWEDALDEQPHSLEDIAD